MLYITTKNNTQVINKNLTCQDVIRSAVKQGATYIHIKEQRYLPNRHAPKQPTSEYRNFNLKF